MKKQTVKIFNEKGSPPTIIRKNLFQEGIPTLKTIRKHYLTGIEKKCLKGNQAPNMVKDR